jgi:transposase InsO family protein
MHHSRQKDRRNWSTSRPAYKYMGLTGLSQNNQLNTFIQQDSRIHNFMIMIDDMSRYCYVYLLKTKDEALNCFKTYKVEVKNQLKKKIKRFRSDYGGEYFSNEFDLFCVKHGVIHERTPPYSP